MADADPTVPSIARVYDFLLGGTDNYPVDRAVAQRLLAVAPDSAAVMRDNRQFLGRAVRWIAAQGVTQFLDLGCGMPTAPSTYDSARAVNADARVTLVDSDAVALTRLRDLAAQAGPGLTVVDGDVRDTAAILDAARLDLSRPCGLLLGALLHFFPADDARALVGVYAAALAPGSYVALSVGRADGAEGARGFGAYSSGGVPVYNHSVGDFSGFFGPLPLVEPGIVDARRWPAGEPGGPLEPRPGQALVGVARVA